MFFYFFFFLNFHMWSQIVFPSSHIRTDVVFISSHVSHVVISQCRLLATGKNNHESDSRDGVSEETRMFHIWWRFMETNKLEGTYHQPADSEETNVALTLLLFTCAVWARAAVKLQLVSPWKNLTDLWRTIQILTAQPEPQRHFSISVSPPVWVCKSLISFSAVTSDLPAESCSTNSFP